MDDYQDDYYSMKATYFDSKTLSGTDEYMVKFLDYKNNSYYMLLLASIYISYGVAFTAYCEYQVP